MSPSPGRRRLHLLLLTTVLALVQKCETASLFFSEYVEGSGSYNRAVEVCNGLSNSVDLSQGSGGGAKLIMVTNAGSSSSFNSPSKSFTLSGVLAGGECLV